jgi:hypothetical protein
MSPAVAAYRTLVADERQEFRLPSLLKEHLGRAAELRGQSAAEYITDALAERVSRDLAGATDWALTVPEQEKLLRVLASSPPPSKRARAAAKKANDLFGRLPAAKRKR